MSGWLFLILTIMATVVAQLFFKLSHLAGRRFYLVIAVALFCSAVPCTLLAARDLGIGRVYIGAALSYVLTPVAAVWLFDERLRRSQWTALAVIVAGIALYSI